ncbi:acyltransferase 3 [Halothece sp. PCC 7418]|uniref:acyltransferase family protein n=1 Tax=Halothece sp. (strain PCC 7418) TaxID=65093 RepID=UPI0002A072EB|nr:acyltransferase family protein [Halothece sp. PCC 7418]AFZ44034.1 acyltransferase 3 [Halothece sp. PCC 7418]
MDQIHSTGVSPQHVYRPEIDGLRALAVVAVIINHVNKEMLPSGYLGVDIFFVISGFVITSSLAGRSSKNFGDFLLSFYTRRIKRLVPVLVLFVLVTSLLISFFNPTPRVSLWTGITSLFGLSNLYLLKQSTDYFAASTELNVFTHTWSLGVEEQFYFLFPFLVWFTGFSRLPQKGSRNLFLIISALSVASLFAFIKLYQTHQSAAYFLMPTRFWEVGAGCILFLSLKRSPTLLRSLQAIPPVIVTLAIIGVFWIPLRFAIPATMAMVVLTALLLACLRSGTAAYDLLSQQQVVKIGLMSYSLYLWHWGVLALSRWTIGIHWWSIPFQITLIFLLALASYRYVETPLRRYHWSPVRWESIGYGIGTSVSAASLLIILIQTPNLSLYMGRTPSMMAVGVRSLSDPYSLVAVNSQWRGENCIIADNAEVGKKIVLEDCTLGNFEEAKKRVLVIGNSFSAAFTQGFDELVVSDGYAVTLVSAWGASPVKEIPNETPWDQASDYYWETVVPSLINRLQRDDWVFLINDLAGFSPKKSSSQSDLKLQQLETGLRNLSDQLSAKGIRLAILHGNPFAREANCKPVVAEKQWFSPFGGPCQLPNRQQSLLRRQDLDHLLTSLQGEGKLTVIDLFDVYCPKAECTYYAQNGQLLYRDEYSHPSVESVRLSAPIIREGLTAP